MISKAISPCIASFAQLMDSRSSYPLKYKNKNILAVTVQSTDNLFIYFWKEWRGKKICGIVIGFCYRSGSVKVHEREVGTVGPYCYGYCCKQIDTVHTRGAVHGIRTVSVRYYPCWWYCLQNSVLFCRIRYCSARGECSSTVF
jgi:hypothetical protein